MLSFQKVNVSCPISRGIHWSIFLKNEAGHNVEVNGKRYRDIINDIFVPELEHVEVHDLWFQQDAGTYHRAHETITLFQKAIAAKSGGNWAHNSNMF